MIKLKTKRLLIRNLEYSDLAAYHNFASNELVGPPAGWRPHQNIHESKIYLSQLILDKDVWAITIDNVLIGTINLSDLSNNKIYEIGFSLLPAFWRKGITSEALAAVLFYAFKTLKIKEVNAKHYYDNYRSKGVLVKAGFKQTKFSYENDIYDNEQLIVEYKLKAKDYLKGELTK